ncbi:hypothetical protein BGY98DRAFT_916518 [Russula aff. rugulosa BPL654]|nr:hypothetical protein BGY98DRAFT_916518 [Russula aff. rugulosa BPL654]
MTYLTSRSFCRAALASSSRLQAPKTRTSRPFTTTAASSAPDEKPQSQLTTRSKGQPRPRPRPASAHHPSAATTHSTRSHNTAALLQQQQQQQRHPDSSPSQTSPSFSSSSSGEKRRPLLQPYELSRRLIELCKQGDVDLAVTALQRAPRNAQNIKVWNTIIQQCMSAKKYKLAYSVFTDMKRRGFMPNIRTYATMMSGYATVDDWSPLTTQLGLVHSVYGQLRQHLKRNRDLIDDDPAGEASFILYPISLYISILGKAGKYEKAFDVFHELDTSGPLAPHSKIYHSLLSVLVERVDAPDVDAEAIAKSVSEAKYIWRRHMRNLDKQPQHDVDPRSIEAMIKLLSRGDPPDHESCSTFYATSVDSLPKRRP